MTIGARAHLRLGMLLIAALSFSASCGSAAESNIDAGRIIALENCARCHAVGREDVSPLDEAPPFRRLRERYPIEDLQEALAEGIVVGHNEMPPFAFDPAQIEALLFYLGSLGPRASKP